jgi:hypothetical protein
LCLLVIVLAALPMSLAGGCGSSGTRAGSAASSAVAPVTGLQSGAAVTSVQAVCRPPVGWLIEPLKHSRRHNHQVWLSPSGKTAYGVIHIDLPLPVGPDVALWGFLREMRKQEGDALLDSQQNDPHLPGIRFVAEGGRYKMRGNLTVHGWDGWIIYAGTLRGRVDDATELRLAETAREHTRPGVPAVAMTQK